MVIRVFPYSYKDGWEINFVGRVYYIRIAKYQFGIWKSWKPIINKLF